MFYHLLQTETRVIYFRQEETAAPIRKDRGFQTCRLFHITIYLQSCYLNMSIWKKSYFPLYLRIKYFILILSGIQFIWNND